MMLLSFVFFEDYHEEIKQLNGKSYLKRIQALDSQVVSPYQKQILAPDIILKVVDDRVKFLSPISRELEQLIPQRLFIIIDDFVQVVTEHTPLDDKHNRFLYHAQIKEWGNTEPGFVQVELQMNSATDKRRVSDESVVGFEKNNNFTVVVTDDSGVSTTFNSDSEYGSPILTEPSTSNNLEMLQKNIYTRISQLPSSCFTPIVVKNFGGLDEENNNQVIENRENPEVDNVSCKSHVPVLFITQYYLNSQEFMNHFKSNIFPHFLAESLGFSESLLSKTTSIAGAILCDREYSKLLHDYYEIIPSIPIPWPEKAFEWANRKSIKLDNPTMHKWPSNKMIDDVIKLEAMIIPNGFEPNKGKNIYQNIEWEIVFPKAELYLGVRMSHPQMRLYLFLITLFKRFIEPVTKRRGLLVEHIRMLIFWECQINYKLWPEDQLGTKLLLVLEKLYKHLGKQNLSHYFIQSRNVFNNASRSDLIYAQTVVHEVLESPAVYMLAALKHLKCVSAKWYPVPDLNQLYKIMATDFGFQQKVPKVQRYTRRNKPEDQEQKWNRLYNEQQQLKKAKNLKTEEDVSVNLEVSLKQFDLVQKAVLLKFFIEHFLKIVKHSPKPTMQLFYLKQSYYLAKLLEEPDIESAIAFESEIEKLEKHISSGKEFTEPNVSQPSSSNSYNQQLHIPETSQSASSSSDVLSNGSIKSSETNHFEIRKKTQARRYRSHHSLEPISDHLDVKTQNQVIKKSVSFKS